MTTCSTDFVSPGAVLPAPPASTAETDSTWHRRKTVPFDPHLAAPPQPGSPRADSSRQPSRIVTSVESALAAVEPFRRPIERRREARFPYPYPIHMTPYGQDGLPDAERTFVVIGKHLAPHGLDFYYCQPLAYRRVVASLDCGREGWIGLVVELDWCRFSRHGWYDNGGRFIAVVPSPLPALDGRPRAA
jgi:hypothetical protein